MKVDGSVFISARKKIRARCPGRGEPGRPAPGTQEWVADEAKLSLRAVQYLENGEASLKTIKAVSKLLGIPKWEEHICDYGCEYVTCSAKKLVDFRPELYPPHNPERFFKSTMLMSIDPLSILVEAGKFEEVLLKEVTATLSGLDMDIEFQWLAEVLLTPEGKGWLGWVKEMEEFYIPANNQILHIPVMFRQLNAPQATWEAFVHMVEVATTSQLDIDIHLHFANFQRHVKIYLSTDLLQRVFAEGRNKYQSAWPYRAQLRTIT